MATFYLDLEGGNDSNDGTTFANRWRTFNNGPTTARIAPGDTIRVMGSPAPTSIGNATWTGPEMGIYKSIVSSTNATPIVLTVTGHGFSTGDTVVVRNHSTNTYANGTWKVGTTTTDTFQLLKADGSNSTGNGVGGATGEVRKFTNAVVELSSALTQNIALCGNDPDKVNWTASANVTSQIVLNQGKEGNSCLQLDIAAGFTTGKTAYYALSNLNLNSYQQLSFKISLVSGTVPAANDLSIKLCSDASGDTAVTTLNLPKFCSGTDATWPAVTIDAAAALGSGINSIAFYVNTDNGAQTFRLDNIIACKASSSADSLTLNSLIGKNVAGETWAVIQSINGTRVVLDNGTWSHPQDDSYTGQMRGYAGTTETVTTYKRETIKIDWTAAYQVTPRDSGTAASPIVYSGGWDRTNMSTQDGMTWLDARDGMRNAIGYVDNWQLWNTIKDFGFVNYGFTISNWYTDNWLYDNCHFINGTYYPSSFSSVTKLKFTNCFFCYNSYHGFISDQDSECDSFTLTNCVANSNGLDGFYFCNNNNKLYNCTAKNNGGVGLGFSNAASKNYAEGVTTANNKNAGLGIGAGLVHDNYLLNCNINDTVEFVGFGYNQRSYILSKNQDGGSGIIIYSTNARIYSETSIRHTASGYAWKIDILSSAYITATEPFPFEIAKVAVAAGTQVTAKVWLRRNNTGLTMSLVCKGGQIAGVTNDVSSSISAAVDTWQEVTITFTPTEAGVVSLTVECYGGSTYSGYIDDLTITQG